MRSLGGGGGGGRGSRNRSENLRKGRVQCKLQDCIVKLLFIIIFYFIWVIYANLCKTSYFYYKEIILLNSNQTLYQWSALVFHYEPPGQNVSIVSQICLIFVSNCLKRSQFCLKHVSDKMSQFGLNLRPFWHLRHNWDCPYLRAIWEQFETFFCVVKKVSKRSQTCLKKGFGGFSGSMVFSGT